MAIVFLLAASALFAAPLAAQNVSIAPDVLIQFLNQTINLYREATIQERSATAPEEQVLLYDNAQIAAQLVQLAFAFARAQASAVNASAAGSAAQAKVGAEISSSNPLARMLGSLDKDIQSTQAEQESDKQKLVSAAGANRARLESEIAELDGEIALAEARREAVSNLLKFESGTETRGFGASDLKAQIDALAASVPLANSNSASFTENRPSASPLPPATSASAPSGIWSLGADLLGLSSKISTIDSMIDQANSLQKSGDALRAPFVAQLRALSNQGDQIATQADTANAALLVQEKRQLDALAAQFKQLAGEITPLGKQRVLLAVYQKNLASWRGMVDARYKADLQNLGIRLGLLGLLIVALVALSELWRRAVYRYVQDVRRRYQFLLLRKLTLWFVIILIIVITLAGRLSSFATYAGLLTAGVAVALQNVIVSIVGYFFLIGKFGIRVGDRVEVTGIAGEVIDIGLVRFHLMELGVGATPTGRVVAFSNSVVFQPAAGLFKQIPGASFAWHQVTFNVPRDGDFASIKKNLLGAVEGALRDYRAGIARVYSEVEKRGILFSERELEPRLELHLTAAGMEATIRYPVDLLHASDIDARVSRELQAALERNSNLQPGENPEIRIKTDVPAGTAK